MSVAEQLIGNEPLMLHRLDAALGRRLRVALSNDAVERIRAARAHVDTLTQSADPIYGINTGFGYLKNKRIPPNRLDKLQENLLVSHAVGVGAAVPPEIVRWMLLFKINMLAIGHSGVRLEIVRTLCDWLAHDLLPVVPTRGSLGASGDLAPLAHLFLPLIGAGEMHTPDGTLPASEALAKHKLQTHQLAAKEGLALINGTQMMSAYGANIVVRGRRLADLADLIATMTLEGCRGTDKHVDQRLHALRPHPGAQRVAENVRRLMRDSEIRASHADCDRVQDPYSLRCVPQVHGAVRDAVEHLGTIIEREINSVTDNPLIFEREAISGGNFHGEPLALPLDYVSMALTELGNISERRTYLLLAGDDVLPKLLMTDTGINSGFMIPQYTAASLLNECKVLSAPASIDSIPTSLGQEDHVSMGATGALKCYEILDRVEHILAIELVCAAQALDYHAPLRPGAGPGAAHALVREAIPHADEDRQFNVDIRNALHLLRDDPRLLSAARS